MKLHFIGIGGIGMSGIADILLSYGHQVSGSDRQKTDITAYLKGRGALVSEGHKAEYVKDVDYVVYSSAITMDNPEMREAGKRNIPTIRRAEMLGQLMNRKFGIAIAGTHGKTTTTSILGEILIKADLDPTLIIGGRLKSSMTNARLGQGDILLAEADEYDRSFLALNPRMAAITSLEADHLDIYADLQDVKNTFLEFCSRLPFDGFLALNIDDENLVSIKNDIHRPITTFGLSAQADIQAGHLKFSESGTSFDLICFGEKLGRIQLSVPGEHNIRNTLAAVAIGLELQIPFDTMSEALSNFDGVERRFDIKGIINDIMIVDDYAHHPTEVAVTLAGARGGWDRKIVAVFQPHLYSRTRDFYREFAGQLNKANAVIIAGIYPAREEPIEGISGKLISDELVNLGHVDTKYINDKNKLADHLLKIIKPGDLVLFMGAGDIFKTAEDLLKRLKVTL